MRVHNYLVSRDRFGRPVPPRQSCSLPSPHTLSTVRLNLWCLLTGFLPLSTTASIYTVNRHHEFIGLRNYRVPMAFTAESPPAQDQKSHPQGQGQGRSSKIGAAQVSDITMDQFCGRLFFNTTNPLFVCTTTTVVSDITCNWLHTNTQKV